MNELELYIDGASKGNPGHSGIGVVIVKDKQTIKNIYQYIGHATNNAAEYTALIYGLQESLMLKADTVKVNTDSELLYNQLLGKYKVKTEHLKPLFDQAQTLARTFQDVKITLVPREKNKEADQLANKAFKKEQTKGVASAFSVGEESPSSEG